MDVEVKRQLTEKLSVSAEVAFAAFGLARNAGYAAIKSKQIPSVRIGGKIVVPTAPIRRMLGMDEGALPEAAE